MAEKMLVLYTGMATQGCPTASPLDRPWTESDIEHADWYGESYRLQAFDRHPGESDGDYRRRAEAYCLAECEAIE